MSIHSHYLLRCSNACFASLATLCFLAGCNASLPSPLSVPGLMRVGQGMNPRAQIFNLQEANDIASANLGERGGLLALANPAYVRPNRLQLTISAGSLSNGYTLQQSAGADPGRPGFEMRLRAAEAKWLKARPTSSGGYRLKAGNDIAPGDTQSFWVIRDVGAGEIAETKVQARAAAVSQHCVIFLDKKIESRSFETAAKSIAEAFDAQIYPTTTRLFGVPIAPDGSASPVISLLISPAVGNYGADTTIGYFTVRDLFPAPPDNPENPLTFSNERLMLYMAPFIIEAGRPADYLGTLAHEFQHLINASHKLFGTKRAEKPDTEAIWLDEMLSMVAMAANGYGLESSSRVLFSHVAGFLDEPAAYSLTQWDLNPEASAYGAVYLFGNYLLERFDSDILGELVAAPETGITNLEQRLRERNTDFATLFGDWALATALDGTAVSDDPRHEYRNLNLLGGTGRRRLQGVAIEAVPLPARASLNMKPTSVRYLLLSQNRAGVYDFLLSNSTQAQRAFLVIPR